MDLTAPKRYLILFALFSLMGIVLYYAGFRYQLGSHVPAEWWVKNTYSFKEYLAEQVPSPKVMIFGGSNALHGIDSSVIEQIVGMNVVNLAAQGNLDLDFFYEKIKDHIGDGDIVVLALEAYYYTRPRYTDWFVNNMLAWGWPGFLGRLPLLDQLKFLRYVPPERIFAGIMKQNGQNPLLTREQIVEQMKQVLAKGSMELGQYSHTNLNVYGDVNVDLGPIHDLLEDYRKGHAYFYMATPISEHFLRGYRRLEDLIGQYHGRLILTWPVTIRNKLFDLRTKEHQKIAEDLISRLAGYGITLYFNPALFNLGIEFFYNTEYHPNRYGAKIRSENLGIGLQYIIQGKPYHMEAFADAIETVRQQEKRFMPNVRKEEMQFFGDRKADLDQIRDALRQFFKDHGSYPKSVGWEGRYSDWGRSGEDWIPKLTPGYISVLPRDPRHSNKGTEQYLYLSDGRDYKLIAHGPEDFSRFSILHPEMVDPVRTTFAYGYWTPGAEQW